MMYYVYKITNKINDSIYIGKTSNPKIRWYHHKWIAKNPDTKKYPIHFAILKYGENNFSFEILYKSETEDDIFNKEKELIQIYRSNQYKLYNITDGGEGTYGYIPSEKTKEKISKALKGKRKGEKNHMFGQGEKILGNKNPFYNKKHLEETKSKMSKDRQGEKNKRAILTEKDVITIRENNNNLSVKELSELFNVKPITIYKILNRRIWKHI